MPDIFGNAPFALDYTTLFVVAICVTGLLGLLLLFAWTQDRVCALAWWGCAYLIGGASVVIWSFEPYVSPPLPLGIATAILFVACGMMWSAARLFHGRAVLWSAMSGGAAVWLAACLVPEFVQSGMARIVLSSLIVSTYTFLTAVELHRERRKHQLRRRLAIVMPTLHGLVFLIPIPLATLLPNETGFVALTGGWLAVFTLEVMLYLVGTAFIVLVLTKERSVRIHQDAASTDELTGILNRRGFMSGARRLIEQFAERRQPVTVLAFDLDHFKSINDHYGHAVGDEAIRLFASVASTNMRLTDVLGRLGGEEFVAVLPGSASEAAVAAERVRAAFETAGMTVGNLPLGATVSVGVASGEPGSDVISLMAAADRALYNAKAKGRNRIEFAEEEPSIAGDGRLGALVAAVGKVPAPAPVHALAS
jgi:diguanylate cyclase (GGDEF)-like protein